MGPCSGGCAAARCGRDRHGADAATRSRDRGRARNLGAAPPCGGRTARARPDEPAVPPAEVPTTAPEPAPRDVPPARAEAPLEPGDPEALTLVLGIVYRAISTYVLQKAQLTRATGATGAVTLIQRFGSALNLNIHFHMLVLDGAHLVGTELPMFRRVAPPREAELQALVERMAERIGRALERRGVLVRDAESSFLDLEPAADRPMDDLLGHSITYRVAVGPRAGQKVFSLQTVPARGEELSKKGVTQYAGFSLHAGIGVEAGQREKLERLARYVSRPPVSVERLALTAQGQVRYRSKRPYPVKRDERSGRNDGHRAGAVGSYRSSCGARAAAARPPDSVSRGVRCACGGASRNERYDDRYRLGSSGFSRAGGSRVGRMRRGPRSGRERRRRRRCSASRFGVAIRGGF
jgi:Putative transposase